MTITFENISLAEIITACATVATAIVLTITLYYQKQDRKPKFRFYRNLVGVNKWTIVISQSDKLIHKLTVEIDDEIMHERNTNQIEFNLGINEGATFDVPESVRDDSEVVIQYDSNRLKIKFDEIPRYRL